MKKILLLTLICFMVIGFVSCSADKPTVVWIFKLTITDVPTGVTIDYSKFKVRNIQYGGTTWSEVVGLDQKTSSKECDATDAKPKAEMSIDGGTTFEAGEADASFKSEEGNSYEFTFEEIISYTQLQ